jgi:hypothetical protein
MQKPNYRDLFLKAADGVYSDILNGVTDIDGALKVLRGILEAKYAHPKHPKGKCTSASCFDCRGDYNLPV